MKYYPIFSNLLGLSLLLASEAASISKIPAVRTVNGTYSGIYIDGFKQDTFLGIPLTQPPTGQRRFQRPHYINKSFTETGNATDFGPACPQYSPPNVFGDDVSEDCPSINASRGKFLRIPAIVGTNSDEGCTFATKGIDTEEELFQKKQDGGLGHFQNVASSFQNITGALGPLPEYKHYKVLSEDIGRAYISFVNDHDPKKSRGKGSTLPVWPRYNLKKPQNIVLDANGSYIEDDTYRKEGIAFLNEVSSNRQILA